MSGTMSRRAVAGALGTLAVATAVLQAQAAAAQPRHSPPPEQTRQDTAQWSMRFSGNAGTNVRFTLYNQRKAEHLAHKKTRVGPDLAWSDYATFQWKFVKCGSKGDSSPIRYGRPLALYNTSAKKYLISREWGQGRGINLEWSKEFTPKTCQWEVRGGGAGQGVGPSPVHNAQLFNVAESSRLVNAWRPAGIDLRWHR
ncbi:hypothetical protein SUDANB176_02432 [Streptomyces sp. enrichment culture]|uniref:hypothetical protein n=1 Tax=Streptomyces sp. enrichment culture TaxID=1795815 RepID=UPI003F55981F